MQGLYYRKLYRAGLSGLHTRSLDYSSHGLGFMVYLLMPKVEVKIGIIRVDMGIILPKGPRTQRIGL